MKSAKWWMKVWTALAMMSGTFPVLAEEVETEKVGGVWWMYTIAGGTATVVEASPVSGHVTIPAFLGNYPVTHIGYQSFHGCTNMTTIDIPSQVERIGRAAFSGCTGLRNIVLGENITSLGDSAFSDCTSLTQAVVNCSVDSSPFCLFANCINLETVVFGDAVAGLDFNGLETAHPFYNCPNIRSFSVGAGVTSIPSGFCADWTNLETVVLGSNVASIGYQSFYACSRLVALDIPASVKSVGSSAFSECSGLTKVKYSGNAPTAGSGVYSGTPEELTSWVRQESTGWNGDAGSTALPETWQERPIRRWGSAEYAESGEEVPGTRTEVGNVPLVWLDEYDLARDGDYEAAAGRDAANGQPVWECYVAGLDPTRPDAAFRVQLRFGEDGAVMVSWPPT